MSIEIDSEGWFRVDCEDCDYLSRPFVGRGDAIVDEAEHAAECPIAALEVDDE